MDSSADASQSQTKLSLPVALTAGIIGIAFLANSIFMIVSPSSWYYSLETVVQTGPMNSHFIRDIGLMYFLTAVVVFLGLRQPQNKVVWWTGAAGRHLSHGGLHTYVGNCGLNQNGGVYAQDFVPIALVVPGRSARLWANRRQ